MKFHYPYQKIVDLKSSEKTQAEWLLSAAIGKLQAEELSLEQLLEQRAIWTRRIQEAAETAVPLAELQMIQTYLEALDARISRKTAEVREARQAVDRSRSHLTDKMKDEKVWMKAKDRAFDQFRSAGLKREQNELDDMATARFVMAAR